MAPSASATYADVTGRIAQRTVGLLPVRGNGHGLMPLDGSKSDNMWQGMLPLDSLPNETNPTNHYLAAANTTTATHVSADNAPGYRTNRLHQVLMPARNQIPTGKSHHHHK